jgi:F-type H+-transporting ATPase subunit delta
MKISILQYAKTLLELTDGKSEQEILNVTKRFALQLKKDGQLKNAKQIIEKFSEIYYKKNGIVEAVVVTSRKLESQKVKEVEEFVRLKYKAKEVEIENVIDEKIQGGIVIKVGDEVLDGSVNTQLKKLKKILTN